MLSTVDIFQSTTERGSRGDTEPRKRDGVETNIGHLKSKLTVSPFFLAELSDFQDYVQSEPPYDFRTAKVLFTSDSLQQALPEDPMDPREFSFIVHKSEVISIAIHDGAVSNDQFLDGKSEEVFRIHES